MDAFEGIHCVQLSPSLKPPLSSGPGYEVVMTGSSGIAVYSSPTFFGQLDASEHQAAKAEEEGCVVGRLIDLEPDTDAEPGPSGAGPGRAGPMALDERGADAREHYSFSRLRSSSLEIKEKGSEILREQLDSAQRELQLKDKECERLARIRDQLEQELEELTASLFEEAHKMVHEANVKQAAAEKQLKEAQGKIDVLQAEVEALKTLVLTSTPSSPNRQLHPQLQSPGSRGGSARTGLGHIRNKSASGASVVGVGDSDPCPVPARPADKEGRELDSLLYAEFLAWREEPSLDRTSAFLSRVYREDVEPCLSFTCSELSQSVQLAVENNTLTIEPVASTAFAAARSSAAERSGPKKCALSGISLPCRHRIKLGDKGNYYYVSPSSRTRIAAACNFFTYVRYIQQGLIRQEGEARRGRRSALSVSGTCSRRRPGGVACRQAPRSLIGSFLPPAEQTFWELMRLRREMAVARLGFYPADED
uniref:RAB3A interacting protein like 1 n=1 Tax=Scleropages formosus TaxID=113540 RepID=A0A8C9RQC0_SCLFO